MTKPTPASPLAGSGIPAERLGGSRASLPEGLLESLEATGAELSLDDGERSDAARDWWPLTIGWAANGIVAALPSAIVRPSSTEQVAAVMQALHDAGVSVSPAAGRSGVCGGTIPLGGGVSLDLTGLDRIIEVDERSLSLRVEAGVFGPDLERQLAATGSGYTLGHWPQSMDLSTVGGWLACRGAGQYSTRYGKIEDMVRGLRVVLADGSIVETEGKGPRSATGPNLTQLFVGSEGTLGIITEATLAIRPVAAAEQRAAWAFASFAEGLDACRRILRRGATPAVLRLYDEVESQRNFEVDGCALIVLDEADPAIVEATMRIVAEEVGSATPLDASLVERWLGHRNDVSALRPLWERGIVVDTIEMAGPWSALDGATEAVIAALKAVEGTAVASVHQSHAYQDGACLYFTFAGRAPGRPDDPAEVDAALAADEAYYRACWDAATSAIEASGSAISHHHGVGLNRSRFMRSALGSSFAVLEAIKSALDPDGIMNPSKLGLGGEAW